jgi:hypothetical protein
MKTFLELFTFIPENLDLVKEFNRSVPEFLTNKQPVNEQLMAIKL